MLMNDINNNSMFYGASPFIFEKAKLLRNSMTEAEEKLWKFLSKNKIMGLRFRPQHPIDRFIADFYCHRIKLIIEVDGGIHNNPENKEYDIGRTFELERFDLKVMRFTNEEIVFNFDNVKQEILKNCSQRMAELKVPFRGFRGKS